MVLKLPKIVHFLQIYADLSKKPTYFRAIYFYSFKRPHQALSENSIFIGVRDINSSWDIKESYIKKSTDSADIYQNNQLQTLIPSKQ